MRQITEQLQQLLESSNISAISSALKIEPGLIEEKFIPLASWQYDFCFGATLLHFAALYGKKDVVEFLIKSGADIDMPSTKIGCTPLHCAVYSSQLEAVHSLLEAKASTKIALHGNISKDGLEVGGWTPLHFAIHSYIQLNKDYDIVIALLHAGAPCFTGTPSVYSLIPRTDEQKLIPQFPRPSIEFDHISFGFEYRLPSSLRADDISINISYYDDRASRYIALNSWTLQYKGFRIVAPENTPIKYDSNGVAMSIMIQANGPFGYKGDHHINPYDAQKSVISSIDLHKRASYSNIDTFQNGITCKILYEGVFGPQQNGQISIELAQRLKRKQCLRCGRPLGFFASLLGKSLHSNC